MNYKPTEREWMAYLYDELSDDEKTRMEKYLSEHPEAQLELDHYRQLRAMLSSVRDKEVIAPPVLITSRERNFFTDTPYIKTILGIAATLLIVILVGRLAGVAVTFSDREFRMSFGGTTQTPAPESGVPVHSSGLTAASVQEMISASLKENNQQLQGTWDENQKTLQESIRKNLATNSVKIDQLVREVSNSSQEQIRQYVAGIQVANERMVKDYFQLSTADQKKYIENLLVDFAQYLQQQRSNDLQLVQTRLNSLQQNTDLFKQETEQILSSIITTVGTSGSTENKN